MIKNLILLALLLISMDLQAETHSMQHGFILNQADNFASHLVASGHHSRQVSILGTLIISDPAQRRDYEQHKALSRGQSYFLFQVQDLDLSSLEAGAFLTGHIVESEIGSYQPERIIVKDAMFYVSQVPLNIINPFFGE